MRLKLKKTVLTFRFLIIAVTFISVPYGVLAGVGQSSVITLVFPPGARATGLGEAFTGLSDDANATFYNPAGLGQAPLANSWRAYLQGQSFTAIATLKGREFVSKDKVWAGTSKGLMRYSGKVWETSESYLLSTEDDMESIASKYIKIDDEKLLSHARWVIRSENGIEMNRYKAMKVILLNELKKEKNKKADSLSEVLARQLIDIPILIRSTDKVRSTIRPVIDSLRADTISKDLNAVYSTQDTELKDLVELKIPFTIAVADSVIALGIDASDRVWIGTNDGLWRYSGTEWNKYSVIDGLPSNQITSVAVGPEGQIAVGTKKGLGVYTDGKWVSFDSSSGLPAAEVTAVVFGKDGKIFAGTTKGLAKKTDSTFVVFNTSNCKGLLSNNISALFNDSQNRLWIGGDNGVSVYTETSWKRFKFPDSKVHGFTEQRSGVVWIGTNKGAISYKGGKVKIDEKGNRVEAQPEWKSYHSKNSLKGNDARGLGACGNDVWIATDKAINQYQYAEKEVFLSYEPLLPAFGLRELWHTYGAFVLPTEDWGTLGFTVNYINMGVSSYTNELGKELGRARSWEGVFGLSYGLFLKENLSLGLNVKFINSALAPGSGSGGEGVGQTFAIDASVLKRKLFLDNLDLGFLIQNMGPNIFYVDRTNMDPIPFTLRLGLVYRALQTQVHDIKVLFDMSREVVKNRFDGNPPDPFWKAIWTDLLNDKEESPLFELQQINFNMGLEYWYANFLALRAGFLEDYIGERYELTLGVGFQSGSMNIDGSYIYSPETFMKPLLQAINPAKEGASGARDGQWRFSFLFKF
jgi:hypothetical protein